MQDATTTGEVEGVAQQRTAKTLIGLLSAAARTFESFEKDELVQDALLNLSDELPIPTRMRRVPDAVAEIGAMIFGADTVPDVTDQAKAERVSLAFLVAYTMLHCEDEKGRNFDTLFVACAAAAQRRNEKGMVKRLRKAIQAKQSKLL